MLGHKYRLIGLVSLAVLLGVAILYAAAARRIARGNDEQAGASIAGMVFSSEELARLPDTELIRERLITELLRREQKLSIKVIQGDVEYSLPLADLALSYGIDNACLKFIRGGQSDIPIEVVRTDKTDSVVKQMLNTLGVQDVPMVGARIVFEKDLPVVELGTEGVEYNWEGILRDVYLVAESVINTGTAETAAVKVDKHRSVEEQDIPNEDIWQYTDLLGESSTRYEAGQSNRNYNMELACDKLSGTVVMPGRVFSMYDVVSPFTEEEGYLTAGSLKDGLANEAIGGGVCQVTTTLYNAVLRAELNVTQRYNHSLKPTYVAPAFDATISSANVDFKFQNNYSTPIFIYANAQDGVVSIKVYGLETRSADRSIRFNGRYESSSGRYYLDKSVYIGQELVGVQTINHSLYKD